MEIRYVLGWVVFFLSLAAADVGFIGFAQPRHCQLRLCSRSNNAGGLLKKKCHCRYLDLLATVSVRWRARTQRTGGK